MTLSHHSSMSERNLCAICIKSLSYLILLVLLINRIDGYSLAKHMEVDKIEHSCPELDNCYYVNQTKLLSSAIERTCACDVQCRKFDDCCIDAPKSNGGKSGMKCHSVKGIGGVYMIGECPTTYKGDESWKELCEDMEVADATDPIGSVPVTDPETNATYKNVYCKLCNGKIDLMTFWKTKLDCPFLSSFNESHSITDDYILKNLVRKDETWGLNLETVDGLFFLECNIETVIPSKLQNRIRRCNPSLISGCPSSWENQIIQEKCKAFLGPRFSDDGEGYRNIYCAICNSANVADLSCVSPQAESIKLFRFSFAHSFALLLDVNVKKGEKVGMIRLCKSGEVYDPFFKKCRELQCLPGFVRRGRKCFPRRTVTKTIRKPSKYRQVITTIKPSTTTNNATSVSLELVFDNTTVYAKNQNASYYETKLYPTSVLPSA